MQISSRFTIAMHILTYIAHYYQVEKITSDSLADSIGVNPVIIRNIMTQLKKAELIEVKRGQGGMKILKDYADLTMLDVYRAVESVKDNQLFSFHETPNPSCPVGKNIHSILDDKLFQVQQSMEKELASISLKDILEDGRNFLSFPDW